MSSPASDPAMMRRPHLRRLTAPLAAASLVLASSPLVLAPTADAAAFTPTLDCPPETYPAAGAPRSASPTPYHAPFTASLGVAADNADGGDGGYIDADAPGSLLGIELGPPDGASTTGTLFGEACGTFTLPQLVGSIPALPNLGQSGNGGTAPGGTGNDNYNGNFILHGAPFGSSGIGNQINVGLVLSKTGLVISTLKGTGSADGVIPNTLEQTSAANGGLQASFEVSGKATAVVNPSALASLIPVLGSAASSILGSLTTAEANALGSSTGGECTLSFGNQAITGGDTTGGYTTPATLSTADAAAGGKPLTGPVSDAQGVSASAGIPQPPIDPDQAPDPSAPGAATTAASSLCSPAFAQLLNGLFNLPYTVNGKPGGVDTFVAPLTVRAEAPE